MNKLKELREQDPQKFWTLIIGVLLLVVCLVFGLVFMGENEKEMANNEIEAVEVPIDTLALSAENPSAADDFFNVSENADTVVNELPVGAVDHNKEKNNAPVYKPVYKSTYSSYSVPKKEVVNQEESGQNNVRVEDVKKSSSRTRVPSDNYSIGGSSVSSGVFKAVIDNRNRTIKSGSTVFMHTSVDFTLSKVFVPKNTLIQGVASFSGERLKISITQVKVGGEFYNVKWKIFDQGVEGVYCPQRVSDGIAQDGTNDAMDGNGSRKVEANVPVIGSVKVNLKKKNSESSVVLTDGYKLSIHE